MSDLAAAIGENRAQVEHFVATVLAERGAWTTPVRPGKWSPAEVCEHIVLSYRKTVALVRGDAAGYPEGPRLLRPLLRRVLMNRVIKRGAFMGRAKTFEALTPGDVTARPNDGVERLREAVAECETALRALGQTPVEHPMFGAVPAADYLRFLAAHTRHHRSQLAP